MTPVEYGDLTCDDELLRHGFVQVPLLILQCPALGAGAKLTYGLLLWYLWRDRGYPGHQAAAKEFGIAERSLKRYISELEDSGLVAKKRTGFGETNSYHLPDPRASLALLQCQIGTSAVPNWPDTSNKSFNTIKTNTRHPSLSFISEISERYGTNARDRKALATSLAKWPISIITEVLAALERQIQIHGEEAVNKPGAYINTLLPIFAQEQQEREATEAREQREQFRIILATAAFYHEDGRADIDRVTRKLQEDFPGQDELIEKALSRMIDA